ncbi:hypothetical protein A2U01_0092632, partial [Trifolium medium]|nr:hypothetical protein [Trifolium medium]
LKLSGPVQSGFFRFVVQPEIRPCHSGFQWVKCKTGPASGPNRLHSRFPAGPV